ncbi:hypothetical protein BGP_1837 [Beggiatoa sp. PS]|nr:hypothetical protein BGP_1837 [Beggiatoa sp. PS]
MEELYNDEYSSVGIFFKALILNTINKNYDGYKKFQCKQFFKMSRHLSFPTILIIQ